MPDLDIETWQTIQKPNEGNSVTFPLYLTKEVHIDGEPKNIKLQEDGFAICKDGNIYAYRNHCPHVGSPLDWQPNQFFSDDKQELICHTHGARFNPINGDCIAGPCPRGLFPLPIKETLGTTLQVPLHLNT
jgi:nitrite reductase/ring-hydroxylating ferredoxin subunit